jgi:hypothetical protein
MATSRPTAQVPDVLPEGAVERMPRLPRPPPRRPRRNRRCRTGRRKRAPDRCRAQKSPVWRTAPRDWYSRSRLRRRWHEGTASGCAPRPDPSRPGHAGSRPDDREVFQRVDGAASPCPVGAAAGRCRSRARSRPNPAMPTMSKRIISNNTAWTPDAHEGERRPGRARWWNRERRAVGMKRERLGPYGWGVMLSSSVGSAPDSTSGLRPQRVSPCGSRHPLPVRARRACSDRRTRGRSPSRGGGSRLACGPEEHLGAGALPARGV